MSRRQRDQLPLQPIGQVKADPYVVSVISGQTSQRDDPPPYSNTIIRSSPEVNDNGYLELGYRPPAQPKANETTDSEPRNQFKDGNRCTKWCALIVVVIVICCVVAAAVAGGTVYISPRFHDKSTGHKDVCALMPCFNQGTCFELADGGYLCQCTVGFDGLNCEQDTNECLSGPCQNNGTCFDVVNGYVCQCSVGYHGLLCEHEPEWKLVFKAVSGVVPSGNNDAMLHDPYRVWNREAPMNEDEPEASQLDTTFRGHYKSSFAVNWEQRNIREVKFALMDSTGNELMSMVFNGENSDKNNWFTRVRLLSSPYDDLFIEPQNFFSGVGSEGDPKTTRRWFINRNYGGCAKDAGWVVVVTGHTTCPWERVRTTKPTFLYSSKSTYVNWNLNSDKGVSEADLLVIFVRTESRN